MRGRATFGCGPGEVNHGLRAGLPSGSGFARSSLLAFPDSVPASSRAERWFIGVVFACALVFSGWAFSVGWESKQLPGVEFRQAQTALSVFFIKKENNFSLAYPTPVLGKPWSIPMEFPLYQWTVVLTGKLTGWGITKAGRAVSIACFYLTLPAVWLLLAGWQVGPWRRLLVITLFLTSPFLLFYSRAFLIETMALMFSLWFCVAYLRAVRERHWGWLVFAAVTGSGAGLVKITTLMLHLVPLIAWSVARLWRERAHWRREVCWMAAAVAVPAVACFWWTKQADAIKALNPEAHFLISDNLRGFNLGTERTRFSPEMWRLKTRILKEELTYWPALAAVALLGVCAGWRRGLAALGCVIVFAAALEIFPELYAYHDYYYVANIAWLLLAAGLVIVGLVERVRWRVGALLVTTFVLMQAGWYLQHYYPLQSMVHSGDDSLSIALRVATTGDDVVIVTGQDWNSMTAYYAQRRALMLRTSTMQDPEAARRAIDALAGEHIGAVVIADAEKSTQWLVDYLSTRGIDPQPVFRWRQYTVYYPRDRMQWVLEELGKRLAVEVQLSAGRSWPIGETPESDSIADRWIETTNLPRASAAIFDGMTPRPVRLYSRFGTILERAGGHLDLSAHPDTRLVFAMPAGHHVLRTKVFFASGAFDVSVPREQRTDGVQVQVRALKEGRVLFDRIIDPVHRASDRNRLALSISFDLSQAQEVEFFVGPGRNQNYARDWFWIDRLTIE